MPGMPQNDMFVTILMMVGFVAIFYFLLIRPQQKRQKEQQQMLEALTKGDRVVTSSGIHGTVVGVKDKIVVLKVAENVKMEFSKSAVAYLEGKEEPEKAES